MKNSNEMALKDHLINYLFTKVVQYENICHRISERIPSNNLCLKEYPHKWKIELRRAEEFIDLFKKEKIQMENAKLRYFEFLKMFEVMDQEMKHLENRIKSIESHNLEKDQINDD